MKKITFVMQTNNDWLKLTRECKVTFIPLIKERGYDFYELDYTTNQNTFLENLIEVALTTKSDYIGCLFDDLFFDKIDIPSREVLLSYFEDTMADYIRLDGRPPGTGDVKFEIDGNQYRVIKNDEYKFSTVLGVFNIKLLEKMKAAGVKSAWDIEKFKCHETFCLAPSKRTCSYSNLLVKGQLDVLPFIGVKMNLSILKSIKRYCYRIYTSLVRGV